MNVCIHKLEQNIESVLRRDAEDCRIKGLNVYLKDNLRPYTNTGIDSEVACNGEPAIVDEARKTLEKGDVWTLKSNSKTFDKVKNLRCSLESKTKDKTSKLKTFYLPNIDSYGKTIELKELDNLHGYSSDNFIRENKEIFKVSVEKCCLSKSLVRESSPLRQFETIAANSVGRKQLLGNRKWSNRSHSVIKTSQVYDENKGTMGTSIGKDWNPSMQDRINSLNVMTEHNFKSQDANEYLDESKSSVFHLTDVEFEQQIEDTNTKHNDLCTLGNTCAQASPISELDFQTLIKHCASERLRSRTDPVYNRAIDNSIWPTIARFEQRLPSKAMPTPRGLTPRCTCQSYQKSVCLPNTAEKPIFKMQHRYDKFVSRKRGKDEEGRLLPTTLTGLERGGYSVMTPYMASVVWSIMKDECVDKALD